MLSEPERKYGAHRAIAKYRGVEFLLTFDEWWRIWQESGKWPQRGCRKGQYVMARFGDAGPYAVGNVFICTASQNAREGIWNRTARRRLAASSPLSP